MRLLTATLSYVMLLDGRNKLAWFRLFELGFFSQPCAVVFLTLLLHEQGPSISLGKNQLSVREELLALTPLCATLRYVCSGAFCIPESFTLLLTW